MRRDLSEDEGMFAVVITEKGGSQRKLDFDKTEVTIGRVQGNDIILPKGNVSKRHSRIVLKDNRFIVVDLKSTNGTYVNGRKITSPLVVKAGDKIYIGDFIITLEEPAGASAGAPGGMSAPPPMPASPMSGGGPQGGGFGPPPLAAPPPQMGGGMSPGPMSGGPMSPSPMSPSPMSPSPMSGGPMSGGPQMGGGMGAPPPLSGGGMGGDMGRSPARSAPPPPRPMGGGGFGPPPAAAPAPPPLPRVQESPPSEPPPMPAGADRFALDEEPAEETAAPSPRVVMPSRGAGPSPSARPDTGAGARTDAPPPMRAEAPPAQVSQSSGRIDPPRETSRSIEARPILGGAAASGGADGYVHEFRTVELGPEGLGPLGPLMEEVGVLEIVVEGTNVLVDRGSGLSSTGQRFTSADSVTRVARHLLSRARVHLDASRPIAEATLPDGTHILAILPPVAVGGALVEIRRVGRPGPSGESLVSAGMLSSDMLRTLRSAIAARRNIVIVGPSDAGVGQLVGALATMGGPDERLLVIEAMSELPIANPRAVRLAAAGTSFSELLVRASRLRADRVVIDGVRGGDAREALILAGSRGGGTIIGIRTASGAAVLDHLEALASLTGGRDGVGALVASAVHVVVRLVRGADGARRVASIAEVGASGLSELFEHGEGGFASTGQAASFLS